MTQVQLESTTSDLDSTHEEEIEAWNNPGHVSHSSSTAEGSQSVQAESHSFEYQAWGPHDHGQKETSVMEIARLFVKAISVIAIAAGLLQLASLYSGSGVLLGTSLVYLLWGVVGTIVFLGTIDMYADISL